MSKIINTGGNTHRRPMSRKRLLLLSVSLLAVATVILFLFSSNLRSTVSTKVQLLLDPARGVCSDNKSLMDEYNSMSKTPEMGELKAFTDKVRSLNGDSDDATCRYMVLRYEATFGTIDEAKSQLANLRELEKSGKKISRFVDDGANRDELYKQLDELQKGPSDVEG